MQFQKLRLLQDTKWVFIYLFILALVIRLPYFFEAVIDWDESTFILFGQSILDGNLPYTELLDAKPPLLWTSFALFILVFGKTVVSIRLAGTICVALTAFMTYLIGCKIWDNKIGVISATLFTIVSALSPSGQAVMSEHIALVPLMAALTLLITKENTLLNLFISGGLITTASLIRLNLAYVAIAVGLSLLCSLPMNVHHEKKMILYRGLAYAFGGFWIVFLTVIPYLILRQEEIWWLGVVTTSLSYANLQNTVFVTLSQEITTIWQILLGKESTALLGMAILVWLGGLLQVFGIPIYWKRLDIFQQRSIILLFVTLVGIEISLLKSGYFHPHYLIQFNAIISLFAATLINGLLSSRYGKVLTIFISLVFLIAFIHIALKYGRLGYEIIHNHRILYGSAYQIAEFIKQENTEHQPVLLLTDHLAYWLTNTKPLTPAMTHPSNLNKEFLLKAWFGKESSSATELSKIMSQHPKFIIGDDIDSFFKKDTVQAYFKETLNIDYTFVKKIDDVEIYKRLTSASLGN